ncbi:MAG: hypothetical protein IT303_11120 [Dehalococcoidia bacterium]|nr:hypothetical protein [Dehalococcoidia bacterium]
MIVLGDRIVRGMGARSTWCGAQPGIDEWIVIGADSRGRIGTIEFLSAQRLLACAEAAATGTFALEYREGSDTLSVVIDADPARAADEERLVRFEIWPATSAVRPSVLAAAERLP